MANLHQIQYVLWMLLTPLTLATTDQLKRGCIRLSRNIDNQNLAAMGVEGDPIPDGNINHITPKKRPRINDDDCAAASAITPGNDDCPVPKVGCLVGSNVWEVGCQIGSLVGSNVGPSVPSYWDSPEAAKLFGFSYKNGDDVYTGLQEIVKLLSYTQQSHDGYKQFVAHIEHEPLTPKHFFHIQNQCLYLRMAYSTTLTKMGKDSNTWIGTCCKEAGFNLRLDPYRISVWNRVFQQDGKFPYPNRYAANDMKPKPPIFEVFPEAAAMTSDFVCSHLDYFNVEMLQNELVTNIIPVLNKKAEDEEVPVNSSEFILL